MLPEGLLRVEKEQANEARAFCDSGQPEPVEAVAVTAVAGPSPGGTGKGRHLRGLEGAGHIHHQSVFSRGIGSISGG